MKIFFLYNIDNSKILQVHEELFTTVTLFHSIEPPNSLSCPVFLPYSFTNFWKAMDNKAAIYMYLF